MGVPIGVGIGVPTIDRWPDRTRVPTIGAADADDRQQGDRPGIAEWHAGRSRLANDTSRCRSLARVESRWRSRRPRAFTLSSADVSGTRRRPLLGRGRGSELGPIAPRGARKPHDRCEGTFLLWRLNELRDPGRYAPTWPGEASLSGPSGPFFFSPDRAPDGMPHPAKWGRRPGVSKFINTVLRREGCFVTFSGFRLGGAVDGDDREPTFLGADRPRRCRLGRSRSGA